MVNTNSIWIILKNFYITYICYINIMNIALKERYMIQTQYKTFLLVPYARETILLYSERRDHTMVPSIATLLACVLWNFFNHLRIRFYPKNVFLQRLMLNSYWLFKLPVLLICVTGMVSIILANYQLYQLTFLLTHTRIVDLMLVGYKIKLLWHIFFLLAALIIWMDEYKLYLHRIKPPVAPR
ncbi:hypothetical protein KR044_002462 [Drosophila immigrans]|nr:hypothetical protein KR044_002462 [Drosophila immigrans]